MFVTCNICFLPIPSLNLISKYLEIFLLSVIDFYFDFITAKEHIKYNFTS